MALKTVKVPKELEPAFAKAEQVVSAFFGARKVDPARGTIEIFGERYVLIRAAALSVEFFSLVRGLLGQGREAEAEEFARNMLFDLAHAVGRSDAHKFHSRMNLTDPIERLSAGPVHFYHTGWAFVDISGESRPSPDENYYLLYDHLHSFEADAWINEGRKPDFPVCVMNAGYSSGWCEESFGITLVASEILCRARGDECCRFIMAPPDKIDQHIHRYVKEKPKLAQAIHSYNLMSFFSRKQAEEKLRRSEERFHDLADLLPQSVFEVNQDAVVTFSNQGGLDMFGYDRQDLEKGISAFELFPPQERQRVRENIERIMSRRLQDEAVEYTCQRKDGSLFPVRIHSSAVVRDGKVVGLRGITVDMTQSKRAQEALLQAKQDWERTFDAVPDLIAILDNDKRILRANKAMAERIGLSPVECVGKTCHECIHGGRGPSSSCPHTQMLQDGRTHVAEIHEEGLGGTFLVTVSPILDSGGRVIAAVHIARDITRQRKAEQAIREHAEQYGTILATTSDGFWLTDSQGKLLDVNEAYCGMSGYAREELLNLSIADLEVTEGPLETARHMQKILQRGFDRFETRHRAKDGRVFDVEVSASFSFAKSQFAVFTRDITERKRAEEALRAKTEELDRYFTNSLDLLCIADTDGYFRRLNPEWAKVLGYSLQELEGKRFLDFVHPQDLPATLEAVSDLSNQKKVLNFVNRYRCRDGSWRWIEWRSYPLGHVIYAVARDITEHRKAEEARRIKDLVIASSVNPIAMTDLEGKLTYANRSFLESWGYQAEGEVLGRPGADFWHMSAEAWEVLRRTGRWVGKLSARGKDGLPLDFRLSATLVHDERGEALCMAFSFVNITEISHLRRRLKAEQSFAGIVGRDPQMIELFDAIREVAEVTVPVLIQGESGTGKELVAAAIHSEGPRADKPFVPVHCGALPEGILESELFGHVKGAFTGAVRDRKGRFELADGGTIFLDEIGDISPKMQVKLLRVVQEGTFERVGGEQTVKVDVRIVSATNKDLREEVAARRFREDLYYRLAVVPVTLPALRERRNDIPILAEHMLRKVSADTGREGMTFSQDAIDAMMDYDWPGNVRELENAIRYAMVKCTGSVVEASYLPPTIGQGAAPARRPARKPRKHKLTAEAVKVALQETGGNKVEAARKLGVGRATLHRFLRDNP